MKVGLTSDIHLELASITLTNTENADVLILAGDIMTTEPLHEHPDIIPPAPENLWSLGEGQTKAMRFRVFLEEVSKEFKHVVYVAGNHEVYHKEAVDWLKDECNRYPNIHFLQDSSVEINGITFLGGTLWTDLNRHDPETMRIEDEMINEFKHAYRIQTNYTAFLAADMIEAHAHTVDYIKQTVDADPTKQYVVVVHHLPSYKSIHERYQNNYHSNGSYCSNLDQMIIDRPQITLLCHGHTHQPFDYILGQTRIVCQPRGYYGFEPGANDFKLKFLDI